MRFEQLFREALQKADKLMELRQTIMDLRADAIDKEIIMAELEAFRGRITSSSSSDVILDVMDFLVGNCSPHMRID